MDASRPVPSVDGHDRDTALLTDKGGRSLQPLLAFLTNPEGRAIVKAIGPIRRIAHDYSPSERRDSVVAPGDATKFGAAVQVQTPMMAERRKPRAGFPEK